MKMTIGRLKHIIGEALMADGPSMSADQATSFMEQLLELGGMGSDPPIALQDFAHYVTVRPFERLYTIWWMPQSTPMQKLDVAFNSRALVSATTNIASIEELMLAIGVSHEDSVVTMYDAMGFDPAEFVSKVIAENPGHPETAFMQRTLRHMRENGMVIVTKRTSSQQKVRVNHRF